MKKSIRFMKALVVAFSVCFVVLWGTVVGVRLFAKIQDIPRTKDHALLIGIGAYDNFAKLASPPTDAEGVAKVLIERYGFEKERVVLLTDNTKEKPTREAIINQLVRCTKLTEAESLFLFFSGRSSEDESGETFWIPKDGGKDSKMTWLRHSDLCKEFFASDKLKARSLCIVSDSHFSRKLFDPVPPRIRTSDTGYSEKIVELANRKSRRLITLGEEHWDPGGKTEGFGIFPYYLRKALLDNWRGVIDYWNLMSERKDDFIVPIVKTTGATPVVGRLKQSPDGGGEPIVILGVSLPVPNVVKMNVTPESPIQGEGFVVEVTTDSPAQSVRYQIEGIPREFRMEGKDTEWRTSVPPIEKLGPLRTRVVAENRKGEPGKMLEREIVIARRALEPVSVAELKVTPARGLPTDQFTFNAVTDKPAKEVFLEIGKDRIKMEGSGTSWSLKRQIEGAGTITFSLVPVNEDGKQGGRKSGVVVIETPAVTVAEVKVTPDSPLEGQDFVVTVRTDLDAEGVILDMAGVRKPMEGSKKSWKLKMKSADAGPKQFTVIARGPQGKEGPGKPGEVTIKSKPSPVAEVAAVSFDPKETYKGEDFVITVKTSQPAEKVDLVLAEKTVPMEGRGTDWTYVTRIDTEGKFNYQILAINKDGKEGKPRKGQIVIAKRALELVNVAEAKVTPAKGLPGDKFTFKATTDKPAKEVELNIGKDRIKMQGSGTEWSIEKQIDAPGTISFAMIPINMEGKPGSRKSGIIVVEALTVQIAELKVAPEAPYVGEDFVISVKTDFDAEGVVLDFAGAKRPLEGSGKSWQLRMSSADAGAKKYALIARGLQGKEGPGKTGEMTIRLRPQPVPDVASVTFNPKEVFRGEDFIVTVKTSQPADRVELVMADKTYRMEGTGTEWSYVGRMDRDGGISYQVSALNKEGRKGQAGSGQFIVARRPLEPVGFKEARVTPAKAVTGSKFTFRAVTDKPSRGVDLIVAGERFKMEGAGTEWRLERVIQTTGDLTFSMVPLNEQGELGTVRTGNFTVEEEVKEKYLAVADDKGKVKDSKTGEVKNRFVDNGDGTVTDLLTDLMWLQTPPKAIPDNWDKAVQFCRELKVKNYTDWRLPTREEWERLVDKKEKDPALPRGHPFTGVNTRFPYWTKTQWPTGPGYFYMVQVYYGEVGYLARGKDAYVWPVRYAGTH